MQVRLNINIQDMEIEVILVIEYPTLFPSWEIQMKMSYIIRKKNTYKRKCASLYKRTLYCLKLTTAKKQDMCKTK